MNLLDALPSDLTEVRRICEARAPSEACGVIFQAIDGGHRIVELANALPPAQARTAYAFDPREQLRVWSEADAREERLTVIFHSHVGVPAAFSPQDRADAFPGGVPLYPGVAYLILALHGGQVTEARVHAWGGSRLLSVTVPAAFWRGA